MVRLSSGNAAVSPQSYKLWLQWGSWSRWVRVPYAALEDELITCVIVEVDKESDPVRYLIEGPDGARKWFSEVELEEWN